MNKEFSQASVITKKISLIIGLFFLCLSFKTYSFERSDAFYSGEETILVEGSSNYQFSHSERFQALSKKALQFYIGSLLNGGKKCTDSIIRNFNQLAERAQYGMQLKEDTVELQLSLDF